MKTLLLKAKEFTLTHDQESMLMFIAGAILILMLGGIAGFNYGKKVMSSGESIIFEKATYTCAKTNQLVGSEF